MTVTTNAEAKPSLKTTKPQRNTRTYRNATMCHYDPIEKRCKECNHLHSQKLISVLCQKAYTSGRILGSCDKKSIPTTKVRVEKIEPARCYECMGNYLKSLEDMGTLQGRIDKGDASFGDVALEVSRYCVSQDAMHPGRSGISGPYGTSGLHRPSLPSELLPATAQETPSREGIDDLMRRFDDNLAALAALRDGTHRELDALQARTTAMGARMQAEIQAMESADAAEADAETVSESVSESGSEH